MTLKIGLVTSNEYIYNWQYHMLKEVINKKIAKITTVIFWQEDKKNESVFLQNIIMRTDQLIFGCKTESVEERSFLSLLDDIPIKRVTSEKDYQRCQKSTPTPAFDLIIHLTGKAIPSFISNCAKFGMLSYYVSNNKSYPINISCQNEYINDELVILSGVKIEKQNYKDCIIYETQTSVFTSIARTQENCYWKLAAIIPKRLKQLSEIGGKEFFNQFASPFYINNNFPKIKNNNTILNNLKLLSTFSQRVSRKITKRVTNTVINKITPHRGKRSPWILMYGDNKQENPNLSFYNFKKIIPPSDYFWADPFVIDKDNKTYIFFEEYEYKTAKGHLSCIELKSNGEISESIRILEKPYHLSYPYILEKDNQYYMIPESGADKSIQLYQAVKFPYKWKLVKNLMEGLNAYDSTLIEHNGHWWLFSTLIKHENCSSSEELYLFYADEPFSSQWTCHPANPIISDASRARPAGKVFLKNGELYRPSQNCAGGYGRGLNINHIIELTPTKYKEEVVSSILPNWDKKIGGVHTLNFSNKITIIDALYNE